MKILSSDPWYLHDVRRRNKEEVRKRKNRFAYKKRKIFSKGEEILVKRKRKNANWLIENIKGKQVCFDQTSPLLIL